MMTFGSWGHAMTVDPFTDRLARVRHRFVSTLEGKIDDAYAALAPMTDGEPGAAAATAEIYRSLHGIVGIGPTVGFPVTGRAAHDAEDVLRMAQQHKRGLNPAEVQSLKRRLHVLREAAEHELRSFYST
jgi:chemotaxis protein histidine kinase CheA